MSVFFNEAAQYRALTVVNEAYIGKTPLLLEIEKQIGKIRAIYNSRYKDINSSPEVIELNRLFERQFGMDVFALHLIPQDVVNAYTTVFAETFDIASDYDLADMVVADYTNGYRFREGNDFCILVTVYRGLFMAENITDGEILAIILHELGHNFADCIYEDIRIANKEMMEAYQQFLKETLIIKCIVAGITVVGIPLIPFIIAGQKHLEDRFTNKKRSEKEQKDQSKAPSWIKGLIQGIKSKFRDIDEFWSEVIARRYKLGIAKARYRNYKGSGKDKIARGSLGRQNEVIADKFAGIYGYGPEQASALYKMHNMQSNASKYVDNISEAARKTNLAFEDVIKESHLYDCHPHYIQRALEELKLLKRELEKDSLDPKAKQSLLNNIAQLDAIIKEAIDATKSKDEHEKLQALYAAYIYNEMPDAVDQEIEDKIEQAFDAVLEKESKNREERKRKQKARN